MIRSDLTLYVITVGFFILLIFQTLGLENQHRAMQRST